MNLILADMPLEADEQVKWIESQITGLDLRALVSELAAVHSAAPPAESLDRVLAEHTSAVLSTGLKALPRDRFQRILKQPRLLFDLQRLVLEKGGEHWNQFRSSD